MTDAPKTTARKTTTAKPISDEAVWEALAAPFPPDQIEKLPKPLKRNDDNRGRCDGSDQWISADGHYCGGWHARSLHLDYVGHAGITTRLNDVLGPGGWDFQPFSLDADGMPIIGRGSGAEFWAKLTIMGVTKWDLAANFSSTQEAVGDALRRCAMRFGVGTYLWSKSEAARAMGEEPSPEPEQQRQEVAPKATAGQVLEVDLRKLVPDLLAHVQGPEWPFPGRGPAALNDDEVAQVRAWVVDLIQNPPGAADPWSTPAPGGTGDQPPS